LRLALRLALRDLRRGGRGLVLLALCLFLGTAALAGIGSLSASMLAALEANGRTLLGGDLELRLSQRRVTPEETDAMRRLGRVSETVTMRSMATAASGEPVLVAVKAVDGAWPLLGRYAQESGAVARRPGPGQAAVARALADRLSLRVGDRLRVGASELRVSGIVAEEPDQLGEGFSLGPRVLVATDTLDRAGLIQPGSLYEARYRLLLRTPAEARATGDRWRRRFADAGWSATTAGNAAGGLRRGIGQLGQFLLLVGLAALAVSGVGVGSGVAGYLAGKTRSIAVLKVLGARSGLVAGIFLAQLALVALVGAGAGLALGAAVPWIVSAVAGDALPVQPRLALYPAPLLLAAALAGIAGLMFALPALARARAVPAAALLRDALAPGRRSLRVAGAVAALAAALAGLAVATATDQALAAGFVGATAVLLGALWLLGVGVRAGVARLPRSRRPLVRLAVANLHRPGAQTDRLVVALGLGFSLFAGLAAVNTSLASAMESTAPAKAPRFFAVDLQPEDAAAFGRAIRAASPGARIESTPSLRGSVVALNGRRIETMRLPPGAWVARGDRTITWSATVPPRNQVVAGRWWPADYRGAPLVSIEDHAAAVLGLKVGDRITVSVLGVDVEARIAALRRIDWSGLGLNFAIVFSPGLIQEAPHALLAGVYSGPRADGAVARAVAAAVPGVTLIRVGDVIGRLGEVLGQVAFAVRVAAGATVAAGIAVLVGAVAASGRARRADAVVLRLLGATRAQLLGAQAIEYALLAALLCVIAAAVGTAAAWYAVVQLFELPFRPDWLAVAGTLAAAAAATVAVGVVGNLPVLRVRPAAALRSE